MRLFLLQSNMLKSNIMLVHIHQRTPFGDITQYIAYTMVVVTHEYIHIRECINANG